MRILAVTGGIGSGKSYIVRMFSAMGLAVYDADSRTKALYDTRPELMEELRLLLGNAIVSDGRIDRRRMAEAIFSDRKLLSRVEEIVFPYVRDDTRNWGKNIGARFPGMPFAVLESAIILERPSLSGWADKVLTVSSPLELRIARVMQRSALSIREIKARLQNQWTDGMREKAADYIVYSDGVRPLLPQLEAVYMEMLK